jgi:hypothetical protein
MINYYVFLAYAVLFLTSVVALVRSIWKGDQKGIQVAVVLLFMSFIGASVHFNDFFRIFSLMNGITWLNGN